jgi:hypothetical protein
MATTCRTCGQANADGTEYCVRCGTKMPDQSSTQLVGAAGQGAEEYPWEPPAEWDPGDLSGGGAHTPPPPTWVATPPPPAQDQVGWNTGNDTGAGYGAQQQSPQWGSQPPAYPPTPPPASSGKSRKPLLIGGAAVVVIAVIVAVVLVATGGKKSGPTLNGVQNQSGTDALATSREALRGSKSVEISGTVRDSGQSIRLDLTLTAGNNSQGTLTISGNDVQLIKVDQTVFIKGDLDFLKKYAGNNQAVLNQLNGKWLKTTTTSDFDLFTLDGFAGLLKGGTGTSAVNDKVTQDTLNGQKVVVISQHDGSKLDIANTGAAVPLLLDSKGSSGGTVNFSNYNKAVTITAPPANQVFDVSKSSGGTLTGSYTCSGKTSGTSGGTLTLNADNSYTVSGGGIGGSWGSSGDQVAFAGGALDKYAATWNGSDTLDLNGSGANASASFTCTKQ